MARIYDSLKKKELEIFINKVSESILQNNISLFLGAGSSMQYGAISWQELTDKILPASIKWSNIEKAQYAELQGMDVKSQVASITSAIRFQSDKVDTYLNYLLNFDYKSLWTTNYDCIIENVLLSKSKSYIPIYKYHHFQELSYPKGTFLYKINGSQNSPETIMITHEDFIDYRKSHEAYLILLKRELLCNGFLFLGCSFDDDILRICIKDILNCIENSSENYSTDHFAIVVEKEVHKLDYICKDMCKHYNISCLSVNNPMKSYLVAYGISCIVKYNSVFISGSKQFVRYSNEEEIGKNVCKDMVTAFMNNNDFTFKFISGMGMSIGHFVSGTIKEKCKTKNINRYLQMEPFPFSSKEANEKHRKNIVNKAGIFIFIYGDSVNLIEQSGMWKEYLIAKDCEDNIIIPLPCGEDSISKKIFENELLNTSSFSYKNKNLIESFNYTKKNDDFWKLIINHLNLVVKEKRDRIINQIVYELSFDK